jgi:N-methylhydantoinase A/oxoprolinase/acetone carboxylase beta subunit
VDVGVDSGGTFTDVVGSDGTLLKIPSTPQDPSRAVLGGAGAAGCGLADHLAHGTTVATNALLERRGAEVALVTTAGFADVVEIARQSRPSLYDPWVDRPEPLVPRGRRLEVRGRLDASGSVLEPLGDALPTVPPGCAVAVCLLHADLEPAHERRLAERLRAAGHDVSASHEVAPEVREYERTVTTVLNAALRPVCGPYLRSLADAAGRVSVMSSAGGLLDVATAADLPVALLVSGPAAGVRAAAAVATACGFPDALSFDMGGTSTDVALVLGGEPEPASVRDLAGLPVLMPSLDLHTIGAGGGSIAAIDPGGALVVGPRSAGARPGPACYGLGGTEPTVTDANLLLGRLPADLELSGLGRLDAAAARRAHEAAGVDPAGVLDVVNANMEQALRTVSVERGVDPAGLALVAFGGAGPLHACDLAGSLGVPVVVVPPAAGVLSAVGLLTAPVRRDVVRSWTGAASGPELDELADALAAEATALAAASAGADPGRVRAVVSFDVRYVGQSHPIRVRSVDAFTAAHRRLNGHAPEDREVEVVAVRASAEVASPHRIDEVLSAAPPWEGVVVGPASIGRDDCAVWVPGGWTGRPGPLGALVLERT